MSEADSRRQAVALVGFMGAGKSAVGERLAAALAEARS
jgi:shikimate kinase